MAPLARAVDQYSEYGTRKQAYQVRDARNLPSGDVVEAVFRLEYVSGNLEVGVKGHESDCAACIYQPKWKLKAVKI